MNCKTIGMVAGRAIYCGGQSDDICETCISCWQKFVVVSFGFLRFIRKWQRIARNNAQLNGIYHYDY